MPSRVIISSVTPVGHGKLRNITPMREILEHAKKYHLLLSPGEAVKLAQLEHNGVKSPADEKRLADLREKVRKIRGQ